MYHDEREINAERMIETLESQLKSFTDIPDDARLLLMLVIVARVAKRSVILHKISQKLMQDPALASIEANTLNRLLLEAKRSIDSDDDAIYLLTHLAAKLIALILRIDHRHPKLIAALVGTVQSTLSTPLIEVMPNTAELSLGLLGNYPKSSFPMFSDIPERQQDLISIRLAANDVTANFITPEYYQYPSQSTFLLDALYPDSTGMLNVLPEILKIRGQNRLVLIQNWTRTEPTQVWPRLLELIEGRGQIEAIINFSSLAAASDQFTAMIVNTNPPQRETLYIDVSMSNRSLPALDGIERMLLAGCIYNLWQGRNFHRSSEYLSSDVVRFINSYFGEGFRPISGLCNAVDILPKTISKRRLVSRIFLKAMQGGFSRPTLTRNSKVIVDLLEWRDDPCCIYVIGNNGEGKSFLLRDVAYRLAEVRKRSIGIPMSHADRFPRTDKPIKKFFEYKGARTTRIEKEIGVISSQPQKIELIRECLGLVGFVSRIYLTLKSELSHDRNGDPRRDTLDLFATEDMQYLNSERGSVSEYEVNFIREGHRTIPFDNLSSGEQSILGLLIKIIASNAECVTFLIDEPEISLHVSWQQRLPRILNLLSSHLNASFVVATHSPVFIANAANSDVCYVSRLGVLDEISADERHSVETLLMDSFETYTPHNREVHERCAKLVALLISTTNEAHVADRAEEAIKKLKEFQTTIQKNGQGQSDVRQASDLELIEKTLGAIFMLRDENGVRHG